MNDLYEDATRQLAPRINNAQLETFFFVLMRGVDRMIYANGASPVFKIDIKQLSASNVVQMMDLHSGYMCRAAELGFVSQFHLLDSLARQLFPTTAAASIGLFAEDGAAMQLIHKGVRGLGTNFISLTHAYTKAFVAICPGFRSVDRLQLSEFSLNGKNLMQADVDTVLRSQPMGVALDAGIPRLSVDLKRTSINSLPLAHGALFYLMRPLLGFKPPEGSMLAGDYQSDVALFEMSFVMLALAEVSAARMPNLRDSIWPQVLRAHIDTFKGYITLPDEDFDRVWDERREIYAALGGLSSLDDYMKGFSWILHETLQSGKPSVGMHGMVETMLFGETDKGVRVSLVPPLDHEFGAGGMKLLWNGRLDKQVFEFLYQADQGRLEEFVRTQV